MNSEKNLKTNREQVVAKIFQSQKVRLYKIKHFIFDFGGVMVEKSFTVKNFFDVMRDDLKVELKRENDPYFKKMRRKLSSGVITAREFLEALLNRYYYPTQTDTNGSLPQKKVNVDYYLELWFEMYSRLVQLSEEMRDIVGSLHKADYTVSLMSNTYDIHARSNELRGFYDLFDKVFLSNEIGMYKPDIAKYIHVLKKLKAKPKNCIFIDDKLKNLIPARELGMIVLRFESIETFKNQLGKLGIDEISSDLRKQIKDKYKIYQDAKKVYNKAKKAYKKARKLFLNADQYSDANKELYRLKTREYLEKKEIFRRERKEKKEILVSKVRVVQ